MTTTLTYADAETQHAVETWSDDKSVLSEEQLRMHFEERFNARAIHILSADDHGEFLTLQVTSDCWAGQREFALLADGSLSW